jgi:glyoxylase-like metal-dependent hydrolase (beta-lactamase superfamily II)
MTTTVTSIEGNRQSLDGGAMFGNVPRPMWEGWLKPDEKGRIKLACRALLIEHQGKRILCETGIGAFFEPKLRERFGVEESEHCLLKNLNSLGLDENDIDFVILSHLHFDHAGGLLPSYEDIQSGQDRLLFPRARYIIGAEAFARAERPHLRDRASFIPGMVEKLKASGRLTLVTGTRLDDVFPDRLEFVFSHGHTPAQMHTLFRGETSSIFFAGDLIPGTPWVHLPVTMGYDRYPEQLIDEKAAVYAKAVPEHWWVFYTHDIRYPMSEIQLSQGKYQPANCQTDVLRRSI